jgi:hypothetical protein
MCGEASHSKASGAINVTLINHLFYGLGDSIGLVVCYVRPMFEGHSTEFFGSIEVPIT